MVGAKSAFLDIESKKERDSNNSAYFLSLNMNNLAIYIGIHYVMEK